MSENDVPNTAADIRALAEQAEAAEAEALAAAARARARAIQLRREAELAAARTQAPEEATNEDRTQPAADAETQVWAEDTEPADEPATVEAEQGADVETEVSGVSGGGDEKLARRWRCWRCWPRWPTVAAGLAIVVVLVALGAGGYMIKRHREAVQQRQRVAEFAAAARQGVVTLTSLDFNNAEQGVQRIVEDSTGSFKDDFLKMADDFIKVIEQSKVVSQGRVQVAAVDLDTLTKDSGVVLVASTSEVTNAAGAKQDPRSYRVIVTLTRDAGRLKISKVEFVP
ncbi:MAG: hypothetical protein PHQ28_13665 [Mycobacterium sp.]|nr:hypothetical protein [Mycobacterium sp.]